MEICTREKGNEGQPATENIVKEKQAEVRMQGGEVNKVTLNCLLE